MSHTRVKTTYSVQGAFASTEVVELYCHHNHSSDFTTFYWDDGTTVNMVFEKWESGNDLWDAVNRLWFPFKEEWGGELKDNVELYGIAPWEDKSKDE
jgi:hypothetical protein